MQLRGNMATKNIFYCLIYFHNITGILPLILKNIVLNSQFNPRNSFADTALKSCALGVSYIVT